MPARADSPHRAGTATPQHLRNKRDSLAEAATRYPVGTLVGRDEWAMNVAEHTENLLYRRD
ncbi:hypothetical protein [Actinoplanes auranticolor]|uniref:Uncharacterized protein n=1 Tax=Actinoplanes auranticolor TaxID=47988 RepID=A0A919SPQ2_9ACTN|nr:hypothetical protein [Actinoplanes auranticolor]GIM75349.1 hypothetical protein Aau02nite_65500 [Actinoplanes auranticolor]